MEAVVVLPTTIESAPELPSISEEAPLWQAVWCLEKVKKEKLLVFNAAGLPSGILDKIGVGEAVLTKLGLKLPKAFLESARKNNIYPLGMASVPLVKDMIESGLIEEPRDC